MAARTGFRWENCLGGGSLKAFKDCERMSFITTSDTPEPLDYKKALYPNSYMINPLQLGNVCKPRGTGKWLRCRLLSHALFKSFGYARTAVEAVKKIDLMLTGDGRRENANAEGGRGRMIG